VTYRGLKKLNSQRINEERDNELNGIFSKEGFQMAKNT
jgi:hypothetical protein